MKKQMKGKKKSEVLVLSLIEKVEKNITEKVAKKWEHK